MEKEDNTEHNTLLKKLVQGLYLKYQESSFLPDQISCEGSEKLYQQLSEIINHPSSQDRDIKIQHRMIIDMIIHGVCSHYRDSLKLWHHAASPDSLNRWMIPSYIVARRSPLVEKYVFDQPYILLCEVQETNFEEVWGVCLNKMFKIQQISQSEWTRTFFGIVSDGEMWQFGKLQYNLFIQETQVYSTQDLKQLLAVMFYIFQQCHEQILFFQERYSSQKFQDFS